MIPGLRDSILRMKAMAAEIDERIFEKAAECGSWLAQIDPTYRKPVLRCVKLDLLMKQGRRCSICGDQLVEADIHVDHIVPVKYSGGNERSNLRLVHAICNLRRGADLEGHVAPEHLVHYLEDLVQNLPPADILAFRIPPLR